ncbi:MAG TPA: UDP-N-acetylmuramoyl-L-alanine--D-glutamate ligase [Acidimicrobiales bacterium]
MELEADRALVVGFAVTGRSVASALLRRGVEVVVLDDRPDAAAKAAAAAMGVELVTDVDVATLVAAADLVSPSPGVPIRHAAIQAALATGVPVWSEFELAAAWDERPIVAVTGTNGKTTTITLVTSMLERAGRKVVAAGNNELPLVDALEDEAVELFVVEASSFRLQFTERFRPVVGTWLNVTPDHLDWHPDLDHYIEAKFRLWAAQRDDDLAIANTDDDVVMAYASRAPARRQTFGLMAGDYVTRGGDLVAASGEVIAAIAELPKRLPHDLSNALAATATAVAAGASVGDCGAVLREFTGLPHRVQLVGDAGGVRWYDDSKATTPASVAAALGGFASVVLIAGGKNKGLDLSGLRAATNLRAVVAIGEAAAIVAGVFDGVAPVVTATSMDEAVRLASERARPGDAVLLSPGCASQDWYRNYGERGDDFARAVHELVGAS